MNSSLSAAALCRSVLCYSLSIYWLHSSSRLVPDTHNVNNCACAPCLVRGWCRISPTRVLTECRNMRLNREDVTLFCILCCLGSLSCSLLCFPAIFITVGLRQLAAKSASEMTSAVSGCVFTHFTHSIQLCVWNFDAIWFFILFVFRLKIGLLVKNITSLAYFNTIYWLLYNGLLFWGTSIISLANAIHAEMQWMTCWELQIPHLSLCGTHRRDTARNALCN